MLAYAKWIPALILTSALTTTGCSSVDIDEYRDNTPKLNLFEYFEGKTSAWGIFEDRFGKLRRSFTVDINGIVEGNQLTLVEDFKYSDGEEAQRIWIIKQVGDDQFEGTADDVIGIAKGIVAGNSLHWRYPVMLAIGDREWQVTFDDWMYLQPDGVMINKASVSKLGIELGTVTLVFKRDQKLR